MSDRKKGAAARNDARHTAVDDAHRTRSAASKKDTKRWCRGKVGVEHLPAVRPYRPTSTWNGQSIFSNWLVRYCTACGRDLAHPLSDREGASRSAGLGQGVRCANEGGTGWTTQNLKRFASW